VKLNIKFFIILTGGIVAMFLASCENDPLVVDVSSVDVSLDVIRMDEMVFTADWKNNPNANAELVKKMGGYYTFYSQFILNNPSNLSDGIMQNKMGRFVSDPTMNLFYKAEQNLFGGDKFHPYKEELSMSFQYYKYYFPEETIPTILVYQSGFNYKIVPNDTLLGIGLEWYIGKNNELIKKLSPQAFPNFEKNKMEAKYLVVDAVKGYLKVKFQEHQQMDNLLSVMVYLGKILYLTDAMLHEKSDAIKMNYSNEEWDWVTRNEKQIWTHLAENELLFNNNLRTITQWINDGPFTNGLPQESPSRVGIYIGWQLVSHYMKRHPETSMKELIEMKDYNRILSAYKPK
jgi:hypothetical protein